MNEVMVKGYHDDVNENNIPKLPKVLEAGRSANKFFKAYEAASQTENEKKIYESVAKKKSLLKVLIELYGYEMLQAAGFSFLCNTIQFAFPILFGMILSFLEDKSQWTSTESHLGSSLCL